MSETFSKLEVITGVAGRRRFPIPPGRLHDPSLTRPFPFPGIVPGNGGGITFRPGHHHGIALYGRAPQACICLL
jgi:hypothetical protein